MKMVMVGKKFPLTNLTKFHFAFLPVIEIIFLVAGLFLCPIGADYHPRIKDSGIPLWTKQFTSLFLEKACRPLLHLIIRTRWTDNTFKRARRSGAQAYECWIRTNKSHIVNQQGFHQPNFLYFWIIISPNKVFPQNVPPWTNNISFIRKDNNNNSNLTYSLQSYLY